MYLSKLIALSIISCMVGLMSYSCRPKQTNPEELITTLKLNFTKGSIVKTFQFKDIDGLSGGNSGTIDTIYLDSNSSYQLNLEVLNESDYPVEDITNEIRDEAVDHQFFFNPSMGLTITQTYADIDANGHPIGLTNNISTGSISSGTLRVNLKHQPGIKDGNQNTGESDIDLTFYTVIR
ncbi:MAG: hypothetical protein WCP57_07120 [Bacteroidota bacterium]